MIPMIRHMRIFISCTGPDVSMHRGGANGRPGGSACVPHLPPHLLADSVGAAAEALGRDGQVVRLVLQGIETFAAL